MHFVRFFKNFGRVDIAFQTPPPDPVKEGNPFGREYRLNTRPLPDGYGEHFSRFLRGTPYPILEYSRESRELLTSLICSGGYDYVFFRHLRSIGDLAGFGPEHRRKIILDFDDVLSDSLYALHFYPTRNWGRKFLRSLNGKLLVKYQRKCLRLGAGLFCSAADGRKICARGIENMFVVPNVYDAPSFESYDFGEGFAKEDRLLFVGSLDYEPNLEGLEWFLKDVYGEFRRTYPGAKLTIVGRSPAERIINLVGAMEGVELEGDVSDTKEYYEKCRAVVVPLLKGGGTRIKILEAALAQRPVLSTPVGAEGLDLENEKEILLFENHREFCSRYEALKNPARYLSVTRRAKTTVSRRYSKEVFENSMQRVIQYIEKGMPAPGNPGADLAGASLG